MKCGRFLSAVMAAGAIGASCAAAPARAADNARISGLTDVTFGNLTAVVDRSISQSVVVCSYRGMPNALNYSVLATGSGAGGAFTLSSAANTLPYEVQWADSPSQTGGAPLQPGVTATGFGNAATGFTCPQDPATASLTVTLRAAVLGAAQAGTYTGSLQLTISPE